MQGMGEDALPFLRDCPCYNEFASMIYKYAHLKPIHKQVLVTQFWLFKDETNGTFVYKADRLRHFTLVADEGM